MSVLKTSVTEILGGVDQISGKGAIFQFQFAGTWATNDTFQATLTDSLTGFQNQIGSGFVSGVPFTFVQTFNDKVYGLSGATVYFSAVGDPSTWNDINAAGNGFITLSNFSSTQEPVVAIAPYQGKELFISRRYVQVFAVDPDPANYNKVQVLPNIGTVSYLSVQPVGDMDVYMLADSGVRSVRVRDASNNAIIADIGTPIDSLVQSVLVGLTDAQKATSCAIVEPSANRYWLFIPDSTDPDNGIGKIYVFSYFPSSEIAAWSTYEPTTAANVQPIGNPLGTSSNVLTVGKRYLWNKASGETTLVSGSTTLSVSGYFVADSVSLQVNGTGVTTANVFQITPFTPEKFFVFQGQVWCRDTAGNFYQLGGTNNNTYDNCGMLFETPFMDSSAPATRKYVEGFDSALEGTWQINVSTDYTTAIFSNVYNNNISSFHLQRIPLGKYATHMAAQGLESGGSYARFSQLVCSIKQADQK